MKKSKGPIKPTTERAAQPRLVALPPEWQLNNRIKMEDAVMGATAILDLLSCRFVDEGRGGAIHYNPPPVVTAIQLAALNALSQLLDAWHEYDEEVRLLQFRGRELTSTPDKS